MALAGLVLIPAMAGALVGGLLDRFVEPWLFVAPKERREVDQAAAADGLRE